MADHRTDVEGFDLNKVKEGDTIDGDIAIVYTRKQAIEDGVLVDISDLAQRKGFTLPVAVTDGLYSKLRKSPEEADLYVRIRIQHLLHTLFDSIKLAAGSNETTRMNLQVFYPDIGVVFCYAQISGGDQLEPVLTIMLPDED